MTSFDGSFYDADYFERGRTSGKGWLMNYHWMPRRSIKEALAFMSYLNADKSGRILDVGCAKGFLVKAMRMMGIEADGCDISEYALSFAPEGCWDCTEDLSWEEREGKYTHIVIKDMLEHLTIKQLSSTLNNMAKVAPTIMCVVPMGDDGVYRINEYHTEISHLIAENEEWWREQFELAGWHVVKSCPHVSGLKDNWQEHADGRGNHVFVLKKENKNDRTSN